MRGLTVPGVVFCATALLVFAQQPTGAQLVNRGLFAEALKVFEAELAANPKSVAANNGAGVALDLMGRYDDARPYFLAAIKAARAPLERTLAERAMAVGYAFSGDCRNAEKLEQRAFEFYMQSSDFPNAGDVADEAGRICLEAGSLDRADEWYRKGHEAGLQEANIQPARTDLWDFRLAHARARVAARRKKFVEAHKQIAKANEILSRGRIADQQPNLPYLEGYVSFYEGDYRAAAQALNGADLSDPFIEYLLGRTYEALGDAPRALEFYQMAAATRAHSVPAAFAQPFAKKKLS